METHPQYYNQIPTNMQLVQQIRSKGKKIYIEESFL